MRARGRTALVATMVGLPVLVGAAGGTLIQSTQVTEARRASWELASGVQARIEPFMAPGIVQAPDESMASGGDGEPIAPELADYGRRLTSAIPSDDRLVPVTVGTVKIGHGDRSAVYRMAWELAPTDAPDVVVPPLLTGSFPRSQGEGILSQRQAQQLGVGVGDSITVERYDNGRQKASDGATTVRVTGILARWPQGGPDLVAAAGTALPSPADARGDAAAFAASHPQWYVVGPTPVTWEDVRVVNALGSEVLSRAVITNPPPMPPELQGMRSGTDASTIAVAAGVAAVALVEAVLLIGPAFAVGARRSQRQLALFAATGADRATVRRVVLAGGIAVSATASSFGVAAGIGVAAAVRWVTLARGAFDLPDLRIPWSLMGLLLVLGITAGTVAAAMPARRASHADVVAALAGRRAERDAHPVVPIAGGAVAGLGVIGALVGAMTQRTSLVVGGIVVLQLGAVVAARGIVALVARTAPHLGLSWRFAARDAARQSGRTAPALAAVLAAIAGVAAAMVFVASSEHHATEASATIGVPGTVALGLAWASPDQTQPSASPDDLATATRVLEDELPLAGIAPVTIAVPRGLSDPPVAQGLRAVDPQGGGSASALRLAVVRAPDQVCPLWADDPGRPTRLTQVDTRCDPGGAASIRWSDVRTFTNVLVDDGAAVRLLGVPGAGRAADALAAGRAVVASEHDLQPDGTVRVQVQDVPAGATQQVVVASVDVPAVVVDLRNREQFGLVLPPQAVGRLGLGTRAAGLVASTTSMPTDEQIAAAQDRLTSDLWSGLYVQQPPASPGYVVWILVAAAFVVGLGATGLAVALSAAEARPDLATLGAVGAAPRMRRRIAAAQAGVLVVTGTVLGTVTGLVLGRVLVTQRRMGGQIVDPAWVTVIPWPAMTIMLVGVPLAAMGGAWLFTRSHLPMVRRIVG